MLKSLITYRDLLFMLTLRDLRIRYVQAIMGYLWAIFMPMLAIAAGIIIKQAMAILSGNTINLNEVVSMAVKVLPWTFFSNALRFAVQSLVGNMGLVQKIYFPREVVPLAAILACFVDFVIGCLTLAVFLVIVQVGVSVNLLWVPVLLVALFLFTTGCSLLLSSANLFFRDIRYIVQTILMFGIFFVPVYFDAATFGRWEIVFLANPMGSIIELFSAVIVSHEPVNLSVMAYAVFSSVATFLLGYSFFKKTEPLFAEYI